MFFKKLNQSIAIYEADDRYILHPWGTTKDGIGIAIEPLISIYKDDDLSELGEKIQDLLNKSKNSVPAPDDYKKLNTFFKPVGFNTWNSLQKKCKYCSITKSNNKIEITPQRNGGTHGDNKGYSSLNDEKILLSAKTNSEELTESVLIAFKRCQ